MNESIILIAHKFPPFSGVGANRWAHISRELGMLGVNVHVLTVDRGDVPFIHENVKVHRVSSDPFYKLIGLKFRSRFLSSSIAFVVEKFRTLFWYDDEAQYWGRYLLPKIRALVQQNDVKTVIATGHPFQANRWAAVAKEDLGDEIRLIQDIRDPWAHNPFKKYLFEWQRRQVKMWQKEALSAADVNVFVTQGLQKLITPDSKSSSVIENGHSFECVRQLDNERSNNEIIVHAGTLANGRDLIAEPFFKLCLSEPEILRGKTVHFYGRVSLWLLRKYKDLFTSKLFVLHQPIAQAELSKIYAKSVFALQFNAAEYSYLVSTKIYEHPAIGLPTLSINCGGEIEDMILTNNLGVSCRPQIGSLKNAIKEIFDNKFSDDLSVYADKASFKARANDYLNLIKKR